MTQPMALMRPPPEAISILSQAGGSGLAAERWRPGGLELRPHGSKAPPRCARASAAAACLGLGVASSQLRPLQRGLQQKHSDRYPRARRAVGSSSTAPAAACPADAEATLEEAQQLISEGFFDAALHRLRSNGASASSSSTSASVLRTRVLEAVAHAGMQCFSAATASLTAAEALAQQDADVDLPALREAISRLERQHTLGEYECLDIYGFALGLSEPPSSFGLSLLPQLADHIGPVEVHRSPEGSRGLRTTRAVKGGELLLCSNPMVKAETKPRVMQFPDPFVATLRSACERSPHVRRVVNDLLSDGSAMGSSVEVGDFKWREVLPEDNVDFQGQVAATDVDRLPGVVQTNCFEDMGFCCLYPVVAMMNHSCTPTANAVKVGDALMVRANQALPAGADVCIPYFEVLKPFAERRRLTRSWSFECACPRCELEKSLPQVLQEEGGRSRDAEEVEAAVRGEGSEYFSPDSKEAYWVRGSHAYTYRRQIEETFPFSEESKALRQRLLRAVEATQPASFTHAKLSLLDWVCTKSTPGVEQATRQTMLYADLVHQTRYGELPKEYLVPVLQKTEAALQSAGIGKEFCSVRRSQPVRKVEEARNPFLPPEPKSGSVVMLD